jgi:hypothetical protein
MAGVALVLFPVYVAIVASTQGPGEFLRGTLPLLPGSHGLENYRAMWETGLSRAGAPPAGRMLFNSLVMALAITLGKLSISLLSAFAIVYFRFPFRLFFFWIIFITLMLPVEVRIIPTFRVVAELGMLNSFAGSSPAMNLIPLDYLKERGSPHSPGLLEDLPEGTDLVGIRPDDLRMQAPNGPHLVVESTLELFEAAGAESHLYVRLAGSDQPSVIRTAGQPPVSEGETLRFHVIREALHPFNRASGRRTGD